MRSWLSFAEKSSCVLDIGASSEFIHFLPQLLAQKAYGFEPLTRICGVVNKNFTLSGFYTIEIQEMCVGSKCGEIGMIDPGGDVPTSSTAGREFAALYLEENKTLTEITVEITSVDTFIKEREVDAVDLIKVDVEGLEADVLAGMRECVGSYKPNILMEALEPYSPSLELELSFLREQGYTIKKVDEGEGYMSRNLWITSE